MRCANTLVFAVFNLFFELQKIQNEFDEGQEILTSTAKYEKTRGYKTRLRTKKRLSLTLLTLLTLKINQT